MNRSERFYRIDQLLTARKVVTRQELLDELEIPWATLKRDLAFLKDRFNAPIIHDRDAGGYRFAEPGVGPSYELPGLWFSGVFDFARAPRLFILRGMLSASVHLEAIDYRARLKALHARSHEKRGHTITLIELAPALFLSGNRQVFGIDYLSNIAIRHSIAACFGYIRASRGKNSGLPSSSVSTR